MHLRSLLRSPGFTAMAVSVLALGIGVNTAMFTVVNGVLWKPLPFRDPARLVLIWDQFLKMGIRQMAPTVPEYADFLASAQSFEGIAAVTHRQMNLEGERPERITAALASANFFPMLGIAPRLGRVFAPEERAVVLSQALWQRRFGSDPRVIGTRVQLDNTSYEIVGVLPTEFSFDYPGLGFATPAALYMPLPLGPNDISRQGPNANARLVARLKPGVAVEAAGAEMLAIARRFETQYPRSYRGPRGEDGGWALSVVPIEQQVSGDVRLPLLVLLGAVGFVLLIACVNAANLLLARSVARRREIAIRAALGASRGQLVRHLLAEGAVLACAAGALGALLAAWAVHLVLAIAPPSIPRLAEVSIDTAALAFTFALSLITVLAFALVPALHAARTDPAEALRESGAVTGGARRARLRQALVVAEIALSLVLLVGAGLLIRSFAALAAIPPGFSADRVVSFQLSLPNSRAPFFAGLLQRIKALPGVQNAGLVSRLPLAGDFRGPFSIEGRPYNSGGATPQVADFEIASPDYFHTMGIPLQQGRLLSEADDAGAASVVVINETMARGFWPNESAIGKRIVMGAPRPGAPWLTIVGVVGDVKISGLATAPIPQMYVSYRQSPAASVAIVVRAAAAPAAIVESVRATTGLPVYNVRTMEQVIAASIEPPRFRALLLGIFAAIALVLAAVGLYGVVSYLTSQRMREMGIRIALGARRGQIVRLILWSALRPALAGVAIGMLPALLAARILETLLYQVKPTDAATYIEVAVFLLAVSAAAAIAPALRATRVDPSAALRTE